jgi:hypothetical protein
LKDNPKKNPNIYIVGELHEQDLEKYFVPDACNASISLGIESPNGAFKSRVLERYGYGCMFEENVFGFEDETAYSMTLLFREYIMLRSFYGKDDEGFKRSQIETLTLLWFSDLVSELWKTERSNIIKRLSTDEGRLLAEKLFDKFIELKNNRRFKRRVLNSGDFVKSWNTMLESGRLIDTLAMDELLKMGYGFIELSKALALSLYEAKNVEDIPCYKSYLNDTSDQALGLFCYLQLTDLRDKYIYNNILSYYCGLTSSDLSSTRKKPLVITIGAGHLPDIVGRLKTELASKVNVNVYAYKNAIEYAMDAKEDIISSAREVGSELFSNDFYELMNKSISFFNDPELRLLKEGTSPSSILGGL